MFEGKYIGYRSTSSIDLSEPDLINAFERNSKRGCNVALLHELRSCAAGLDNPRLAVGVLSEARVGLSLHSGSAKPVTGDLHLDNPEPIFTPKDSVPACACVDYFDRSSSSWILVD